MIAHASSTQSTPDGNASTATRRTRIKICGVTRVADAAEAIRLGADAIGLIFAESVRRIDVAKARKITESLPPFVASVGVFRDQSALAVNAIADAVGLHIVQLHGSESPRHCAAIRRPVIKCIHVAPDDTIASFRRKIAGYDVSGHLLDPGAGQGRTFDWSQAANVSDRLILAGGLSPQNIAEALAIAAPSAVDVCTGVECEPGIKDHAKLSAFIQEVRRHDADALRS